MSEHQQEEGMTSSGVVKLVVLSIVGFIVAIVLLAKLGASFRGAPDVDADVAQQQAAERIQPVGQVTISEPDAPVGSRTGESIYKNLCISCHGTGAGGAPKLGDTAAWGSRIAKGFDVLVNHALNGFNAMPAKGGAADLTEDEIKRAVAYIANGSGANFAAPAVQGGAASGAAAAPAAAADGKAVFESTCAGCHTSGAGGAPKLGDKADWAARVGQGKDTLYKHALEGFQGKAAMAMPAKGGNAALAEADVKAAVDYMVDAAK